MTGIPKQLHNPKFRFVLIGSNKRPCEKGWQLCEEDWERQTNKSWKNKRDGTTHATKEGYYYGEKHNYKFDDPKLLDWINEGKPIGLLCGLGSGGLVVVDADKSELLEDTKQLPKTFREHEDAHIYFLCPEIIAEQVLKIGKVHYGEIKSTGRQVVVYPDNNEIEIREIKKKTLFELLKKYISVNADTNYERNVKRNTEPKAVFKDKTPCAAIRELINKGAGKDYRNRYANIIVQQLKNYCGYPDEKCLEVLKIYNNNCTPPRPWEKVVSDFKNQKTYEYPNINCNTLKEYCPYKDNKTKCKKHDKFKNELSWLYEPKERIDTKTFEKAVISFFNDKKNAAVKFYDIQPIYFDKAKLWWLWNQKEYKWSQIDDIDVLNAVSQLSQANTIDSRHKTEIITALQQLGRKKKPSEPEKSWIQFKDKIVDVKTGEEFAASAKYFVTNPIPWKLGESEETPTIDKLFKEWVVMEGVQDESYVDTLFEIVAYSGLSHQFLQRLFAFQGIGCNGKGCFLKLVTKYLGEDNICTSELKLLSENNFESSALYKKQAVMMGEVDSYDLGNTNLLKKLTGEDDIRYAFKGKTPFTDKSNTTCFIATNAMPITPDQAPGFYRRWLIVDFPHIFPVGKDIINEIPEKEFENLARKCVRICKELYEKQKFTNEGNIEERAKRYEKRSNPLMVYVETEAIEDPEEHTILADFYEIFNEYLRKNRLRLMTKRKISKILREEGFQVKGRKTVNKKGEEVQTTCIFGIKLKKGDIINDKNH